MKFPCLLAISLFCLAGVFCSCESPKGNDIATLEAAYQSLTKPASQGSTGTDITTASTDLANAYIVFATDHPEDPKSAEYLYKASILLEPNHLDPAKSLECLQSLIREYPNHYRVADAYFKSGFIHLNIFNDEVNAREAYATFIKNYPDHDMVPSALREIETMGLKASQILDPSN